MGSFSIWHLLIILLFVSAIYGIYRFAKHTPPAATDSNGPAGVGGWLLLLVVGLMFLGPLLGAGRISTDLMSAEVQYPSIQTVEAWSTFKTVTWWSFLIFSALSFYAGLGLAKGRDMSVVKRAKVLLWVTGPAATLVMGIFVPLAVFGKIESDPQLFGALIGSVIPATIWTAYLTKSKRVKATYGTASQQHGA